MLILGNKYQFLQEDYNYLQNKFNEIHTINISNSNNNNIIEQIKIFIKTNKVSHIILNLEKKINLELEGYLENLDYEGIKFFTFSDFSIKFLHKTNIELNEENYKVLLDIKHDIKKQVLKRSFDILFTLSFMFLLIPIIIIIALWIKIKSPNGDIFFTQQRLGLNGRFFRVYKFRTMIPNAEKILEEWLERDSKVKEEYFTYRKLKEDPRIIKGIGHFLRKTSLDELPQFFNVLLGDMSIVGPRPYIYKEFEQYTQTHVDIISSVKPGVTGLWQVTERNEATFDSRVNKDIEYIVSQSFWMDIKIIFQTVKVMILKEGN
jgi:undecaprenyl-phosphate galactose phosphotransferase